MRVTSLISIGTVLAGAALEYYAYMLFTIMSPLMSPVFNSPEGGLTAGYLIIFLAALIRPIGGLLIGYIGDKKGKSVALFWCMIMMSFASFAIAYLPSYAKIGIWASVILLILRMLQVTSAAGELNGSAIFLIDTLEAQGKKGTKGLASGLAWSFTVLGMLGGSVAYYYSTPDNWRWTFLLGGGIGLFALILRFLPKETPKPTASKKDPDFKFARSIASSILIAAGISGMFYYTMIFIPGEFKQLQLENANKFGAYYFALYSIMLLFGGWLNDKIKKKHIMLLLSPALVAILGLPTLHMKSVHFHLINVAILALYVGPSHAVLYRLFPREYRYRSVSTAYSVGTSIIGGITPYICTKMKACLPTFPAYWLMFVAGLAFVGVALSRKTLVKSED